MKEPISQGHFRAAIRACAKKKKSTGAQGRLQAVGTDVHKGTSMQRALSLSLRSPWELRQSPPLPTLGLDLPDSWADVPSWCAFRWTAGHCGNHHPVLSSLGKGEATNARSPQPPHLVCRWKIPGHMIPCGRVCGANAGGRGPVSVPSSPESPCYCDQWLPTRGPKPFTFRF